MDPDLDHAAVLNQIRDGFNRALGLVFTRVTRDEICAEIPVGPNHLQPYGVVHGGVYSAMIETLCSVGAAMDAMTRGQSAVGLENHTSFLRAVRGGTLRGSARAIVRGKRSQVWEGSVHDDGGALVATGRVRMICLEAGAAIAGRTAGIEG
jgi:1,4-dihydroxy-2-naphthoyl-CoA hydrolase